MNMRTLTGVCAVLVVAAIVLAGCLGMKTPPVPDPAAPSLFVDYQRTGGVAGVDDRLVIFDNGVTLVKSRTATREILLNQSDLEQLSAVFDAGQFANLEGNYTSPRGGADLLQYSISYQGRTIITEDTALPPSLEPVIRELDRIIRNNLNSGQVDLSLPRIGS
jgi:hypothetical protein